MAITFPALNLTAPDASIIGILTDQPIVHDQILQHPFATDDAVTKSRGVSKLLARRRAGETIVFATHDESLLERCADEVWWLREGRLVSRGDPSEVLPLYRKHVAEALRELHEPSPLAPAMRSGDGRATLEAIELSSTVWRSGESATIRVTVVYNAAVEKPVIGILIRTRIGLNVYGTNTELENIDTGPVQPGERLVVTYSFRCDLCPGDYTVTAASHDPDGLWHDWQEDAVAFAVTDDRYTAGVANLRARVYVEHKAEPAAITSPPVRNS